MINNICKKQKKIDWFTTANPIGENPSTKPSVRIIYFIKKRLR